MDVLDKTGVGTLWSICKTKFALAGHTHTKVGDGGIIIYPMASNEVNFGGINKDSTIYFGYRKVDDRPVPTNFVFGGIGTATLIAAKFKGALEGNASTASNASKVNGHTVNADVPSGAKFTDTNTWRGIQNNLTSDSTSDSLSAAQGKVLKGLIDSKANSSDLSSYAKKNEVVKSVNIMSSGDTHSGFTPTIIVEGGNGSQTSLTIDKASSSINGLMSIKDKNKLDFFDTSKVKNGVDVSKLFTSYGLTPILPNYGTESMSVAFNTVGGDMPSFEIVAAKADVAGLMSSKDKIKLDGIATGANKYTLPVASATTLGGIKVTTKATGTQWPICVDDNGIAYAYINGLSQGYDNSIDSLLVVDSDDHSAKYGYNGIDVGMSDSASHHIDFPSKSGTFALTSDCLSSKKGSVYPGDANGFRINFTSAQQIVLLDASGNYNISDWYDQSSIGNVLDMYPCGLMGGKLSSGNYKNLFKVMQTTQGGPKLTSINDFDLNFNVHVRLIHIDGGVLVCPYTLNY